MAISKVDEDVIRVKFPLPVPRTSQSVAELPFIDVNHIDQIKLALSDINKSLSRVISDNESFCKSGGSAFVTLCSPSYYFGLLGLARSLRSHSNSPLICLVDSEFDQGNLDISDIYFLRVPRLKNSNYNPHRQEFSSTLSKLWVFGLEPLSKIVFLDCDTVVLKPLDHLFDLPAPAFAADFIDHAHTQRFNSGVFVAEPNVTGFLQLIGFSRTAESYDGGDQGVLNNYFCGNHHWLPQIYNTTKHYAHYAKNVNLTPTDIAIIHYIVKKPWEIRYRELADSFLVDIEEEWTRQLTKEDLLQLVRHWRKEVFQIYEREKYGENKTIKLQKKQLRRITRMFIAMLCASTFVMAILVIQLVIK